VNANITAINAPSSAPVKSTSVNVEGQQLF
jgi:hypothetical protein